MATLSKKFSELKHVYSILMNRFTIAFALVLITFLHAISQSKVVPISKSELTGIELPAGSKKDSGSVGDRSGKCRVALYTINCELPLSLT